MTIHPNAEVNTHLHKIVGDAGFTVSGLVATITGTTTDEASLRTLVDGLHQQKYVPTITAGVLKFQPRS